MFYHVIQAEYLENYKIWMKFEDGKCGEVNFENEFDGPVFYPLKELSYFRNFKIDGKTIQWENGADFAPEYLYNLIKTGKAVSA